MNHTKIARIQLAVHTVKRNPNVSEDMDGAQLLLMGAEIEMLELLHEVLSDSGFKCKILESVDDLDASDAPRLLICDELQGALNGESVFAQVKDDSHLGFLLLADDIGGERLASCLNMGMHEVVAKPFDVLELHARILRVLKYLEMAETPVSSEDVSSPEPASEIFELRPSFEGDLEYLGLPDLLLNLKQNSRTGELTANVTDGDYVFSFKKGELVRVAGPRGLKHRKAMFRALRETVGRFSFQAMDDVNASKSTKFENLDNLILQAMQEADEYPLYRERLPADPTPVTLTAKVESVKLPDSTVIQPLLEGLIQSTTVDILIHASPKTDLHAAKELKELMDQEVIVESGSAEAAS